ncbi:Alpha-D-ribose 1-methylphosphonate 5-triphosphate diphosphatase [Roseovarius litorisediminis]|uniref:Alpha-D-ribose 1-methylphosphonate 5-triphosphate diphosphatase n=1 Tax=Roseovarius litorisediminis TaxID=1312363 RepID=A0A1Y5TKR7_9RHOB|nr:alpha-D-ribose 1-methylphosphonate 5-triphosphate diphosphatase [Roseovarius litorisediminis]SLN65877.1 Alpha-D-ribose 1-methylphosphonate 5-triphosphate diphosphatase [Roseovarius litorisediminis]
MNKLELRLVGAQVLTPIGLGDMPLSLAEGQIVDDSTGREVDLSGFLVLPGIVDAHGDGFERHLAPRRGAMKDLDQGLIAAEAELAANGITTAMLAQFYSWEGGMRGPEFAEQVFTAITAIGAGVMTDLRAQLRFETSMLEHYDLVQKMIARHGIGYVVFNDHLPHEALEKGKRPPRLTGQALRIGRNPEKHLEFMQGLHARMGDVPNALTKLSADLLTQGVLLGSHDDRTVEGRAAARARGVTIAEFPETAEAIEAACAGKDPVIMGAPNVVRGGSHNGNVSAIEMVMMGLVDALASDYHYPSLRRAAFLLADSGVTDLTAAWALISSGPAQVLGLADRGELSPGKRADLVVMDAKTRTVAATIAGGRVSYMSGEAAARFVGAS